jgi:hypothetical protein
LTKLSAPVRLLQAEVAVRQADLRAHSDDLNAIAHQRGVSAYPKELAMFAKAAIALVLLIGPASSGLGTPMHMQTVSILDQRLDALAGAMRAVTSQGLFAEEYDAILEAAQDDPQLREKIIEHMIASPK